MKILDRILALLLCILAMSCSSVKVTSDYDKQAKFADYKTYQFTEESNRLPINDLNRRRLLEAVSKELAAKGFTKSDNPDALVDLVVKVQNKQTTTAYTNYYGTGYAYRWGGGFTSTNINVEDYTEGTLFIDLIEAKNKQLVWQGRATGVLSDNTEKRGDLINEAVRNIMTKYPPSK